MGLVEANSLPDSSTGFRLFCQRYFASGWAFLLPYLLTYLLYAWRGWSVDPAAASAEDNVLLGLFTLFRLYHFVHLGLLGYICTRGNWFVRHRSGVLLAAVLALFFLLPGTYLEYPADPWAHLARINQWFGLEAVRDHPHWAKFEYFLFYSIIGHLESTRAQLWALDGCYAGTCLLLCWAHYRLARSLGLSVRWAALFIGLNVLLAGNDVFNFYRYYGMSTSLYGQLAAVSLMRWMADYAPFKGSWKYQLWEGFVIPGGLLLLAAFSHLQSLGIAFLGVGAIALVRLGTPWRQWWWRPLNLVLAANLAVYFWYPRGDAVTGFYRTEGWLNAWFGFNLLDVHSPAYARAVVILGLGGLLNLISACLLWGRSPRIAGLTLLPVALLLMPAVALPVANTLAQSDHEMGPGYIITYHRLLFAVPAGLSLVALAAWGEEIWQRRTRTVVAWAHGSAVWFLGAALVLPLVRSQTSRFYHLALRPPADLAMAEMEASVGEGGVRAARVDHSSPAVLSTRGGEYVLEALGVEVSRPRSRMRGELNLGDRLRGTAVRLQDIEDMISPYVVLIPNPYMITEAGSGMGYLSGHWIPTEVALEHAGAEEFQEMANTTTPNLPSSASP